MIARTEEGSQLVVAGHDDPSFIVLTETKFRSWCVCVGKHTVTHAAGEGDVEGLCFSLAHIARNSDSRFAGLVTSR